MHDIKYIRENPEEFDAAMAKRFLPPIASEILQLDADKRELQTKLGELQAERNTLAKQVGMLKKNGENADEVMAKASAIGDEVKTLEASLAGECEMQKILESLPNMPASDVPVGKDEAANIELRVEGEKPAFDFEPKQHFDIGEQLGQMDFETAAKMSGSRFVLLKGQLARLERALAQFMLDENISQGYEEVSPPYLVRDNAMYGTGQLPKFAEDSFQTTNGYWLIPTAEVSLTNLVAGSILSEDELPLRYTAYTPCFRSEAGSAGRDTRGMIRLHQFQKVELVAIVTAEKSQEEHEKMLGMSENILQKLGLSYRVMLLSSGDMGFGATKTYDLEVWLAGQNAYREIASISNCEDFQARRMKARYRKTGEKKAEFLHTLNGSSLAVGRTMVAVLENYQQADGSVIVPEVLQPYMSGCKVVCSR